MADSAAVGVTVDVTVDVADTSSLPMVNVVDEAGVTSDSEMSTAVASVCDATGDGDGDRGDDQSVDGTDGSEDEDEDDDVDNVKLGPSSDIGYDWESDSPVDADVFSSTPQSQSRACPPRAASSSGIC